MRAKPALIACLAIVTPVLAAPPTPLPVVNPSFEDPPLPNGQFALGGLPGWSTLDAFGPLDPPDFLLGEPVPDGENVAFSNLDGASVEQVVEHRLEAGTRLTLRVSVGARSDSLTFAGYTIGLWALDDDGTRTQLARADTQTDPDATMPEPGRFVDLPLTAPINPGPLVGDRVVITLGSYAQASQQTLFDNVRLVVSQQGVASGGGAEVTYPREGFGHSLPNANPIRYDRLTSADFDGDGLVDLVAGGVYEEADVTTRTIVFLRALAAGGFEIAGVFEPGYFITDCPRLIAADLDRDGDADAVSTNGYDIEIFWNDGDFAFSYELLELHEEFGCFGVGDVNGDGWADLISMDLAGFGSIRNMYVSYGSASGFTEAVTALQFPTGLALFDIACADIDADGFADVVVAAEDYPDFCASIYYGGPSGPTSPAQRLTLLDEPRLLVIEDARGTPEPDIVLTAEGSVYTFENLSDRVFATRRQDLDYVPAGRPRHIDLNHNGTRDLLLPGVVPGNLSQEKHLWMRRSSSGRYFTAPVGRMGLDVIALDVDRDGWEDAVFAGQSAGIGVLFNRSCLDPNSPFTQYTFWNGVRSPAFLLAEDLDGDTLPDAVVANGSDLTVMLAHASGGFPTTREYEVGAFLIRAADIDRDGLTDLVLTGYDPSVRVMFAAGAPAVFAAPVGTPLPGATETTGGVVTDLDDDGWCDVIVTTDVGTVQVFEATGRGPLEFRQQSEVLGSPFSVAVADLDGDLDPDVIVADMDGALHTLQNQGGVLSAAKSVALPGEWPYWVESGDFDADGRADIAVSYYREDLLAASVLYGDGLGAFEHRVDIPGPPVIELDVADVNADGADDLLMCGEQGSRQTFGNEHTHNLRLARASVTRTFDVQVIPSLDVASAAFADTNADGLTDIIAPGYSDPAFPYLNIIFADPARCSSVDIAAPYAELDFADVLAFLTAFGEHRNPADPAPPFGVFDFSDVFAFLTEFAAGCP